VSTTRRIASSVESGVELGGPSLPPHPPAARAIAAPIRRRTLISLAYDNPRCVTFQARRA